VTRGAGRLRQRARLEDARCTKPPIQSDAIHGLYCTSFATPPPPRSSESKLHRESMIQDARVLAPLTRRQDTSRQ
jgi:hypothetical protein